MERFADFEKVGASSSRQLPRFVALTPAAVTAGVEIGMTAAQGQARCGHLTILPRDREREVGIQNLLLDAASRTAADFESTTPGLVTIDLSSVPQLSTPGTLERLGHGWIAAFADYELEVRVGFAPNPDLAALAARIADPVHAFVGDADSLREQLASLPLEVVDPPVDYLGILTLWGIATLGEFTVLPRDEVAEGLGPDATELWDRAAGRHHRLLHLVRQPQDFSHAVDLDDEISTLEPLMFLLRRSLETLAARLASVYLATSEISLVLRFSDGSKSKNLVRVPDPSRDVERLFSLLHTRLEDTTVSRPIEGYRIKLTTARPGEQPFHLFETTLRDPNRFAETLAQIEALVGSENAGSPVPLDTHRPDSFVMRPFEPGSEVNDSAKVNASLLPAVQGLPLRRFRPPRPIELSTRRDPSTGCLCPAEILSGQIQGRLRGMAGPWQLSGEWWESARHWRREEWDIQLEDGSLCRIARCEEPNSEKKPTWYLEGVYG